ncbi:MAG: hypothetical protein WCC50_15175, partial [Pseudolabrys sp.]
SIHGLSATLEVIILACDSAPLAPTFWVRSAKSFGAFSLAYIGFVLPETATQNPPMPTNRGTFSSGHDCTVGVASQGATNCGQRLPEAS